MKPLTKLWIGIVILIILSPLGLIIPAKLGAGSAWGEWSSAEITKLVGYLPAGMAKEADRWKAPMPDYAIKGQQRASTRTQSGSYIISGLLGVAGVVVVTLLIGKAITRREESNTP